MKLLKYDFFKEKYLRIIIKDVLLLVITLKINPESATQEYWGWGGGIKM